jgi:hypothetical protein
VYGLKSCLPYSVPDLVDREEEAEIAFVEEKLQ